MTDNMIEKNRVCIIIPYFGRFPNYFDLWLYSCGKNTNLDFLMFSNNEQPANLPANFTYIKETFDEHKARFQKCFDFTISLDSPYKLCDYRAAYGEAFDRELEGYDFWGFIDMDLILGDTSKWLTDERLDSYDKIYSHGHLTLMRNTRENNLLYRNMDFKKVFTSGYPFHFDEGGGITKYYELHDLKEYRSVDMADVLPFRYRFSHTSETIGRLPQIYRYNDGKAFCIFLKDGKIQEQEYIYIHLQKRPMGIKTASIKSYYIVPNEFIDLEDNVIPATLDEQKKQRICWHWYKARSQELYNNIKKGSVKFQFQELLGRLGIKKYIVY